MTKKNKQQYSNDVLLEKIQNIDEKLDRGFKGVHDRQDETNGKVKENTEHRIKFESNLAVFKWLFGTLGLGNVVMIIDMLFNIF